MLWVLASWYAAEKLFTPESVGVPVEMSVGTGCNVTTHDLGEVMTLLLNAAVTPCNILVVPEVLYSWLHVFLCHQPQIPILSQ